MNEIEAWLARDENRFLYLYRMTPNKGKRAWTSNGLTVGYLHLDDACFPEVQWSDENPTKVTLKIVEKQPNKIELWAARDESGMLYLYSKKPQKRYSVWLACAYLSGFCMHLDDASFPEVQWSDAEPTKVKLVIDK